MQHIVPGDTFVVSLGESSKEAWKSVAMKNSVALSAIPEALRLIPQWVLWKYGKPRENGKPSKAPYTLNGSQGWKTPSAWSAFDAVRKVYELGGYAGVGFVLTPDAGFIGIDLDHCIDESGVIVLWAQRIMNEMNSYTEVSPSGCGLHIFVKAKLPSGYDNGKRKGSVEVYADERYLTVTGRRVDGTPPTIEARQRELEVMLAREIPPTAPTGGGVSTNGHASKHPVGSSEDDDALLERMRRELGDTFCALYDRGDTSKYKSHSEAVWVLVKEFVRVCGVDPPRIDRFFRKSALMCPKWDEKRGAQTYGEMTIQKACEQMMVHKEESEGDGLIIRSLDQVEPESVSWLWRGRIPRGKVTLLVGDPGSGKSFLSLALAAAITSGRTLPDDDGERFAESVIMWNGEDGIADTIRPRAEQCGVALERLHVIEGATKSGLRKAFGLDSIERLRAKIQQIGDIAMVVVDPIAALLGGKDTHRDTEVRAALQPLADLARECRVAVLAVMHLRKSEAERVIYRVGGSIAFAGLARSVLLVARDQESGERAIVPIKANLSAEAPPVTFRIGEENGFQWGSVSTELTAERLLARAQRKGSAVSDAQEKILDALAEGELEAQELQRQALDAGILARTFERARKELKSQGRIYSRRDGFGVSSRVLWSLGPVLRQESHTPPKDGIGEV